MHVKELLRLEGREFEFVVKNPGWRRTLSASTTGASAIPRRGQLPGLDRIENRWAAVIPGSRRILGERSRGFGRCWRKTPLSTIAPATPAAARIPATPSGVARMRPGGVAQGSRPVPITQRRVSLLFRECARRSHAPTTSYGMGMPSARPAATGSMIPWPKSGSQPGGPPPGLRAVSLRISNRSWGTRRRRLYLVRRAATQPAATGQAAETPVSGTPGPTDFGSQEVRVRNQIRLLLKHVRDRRTARGIAHHVVVRVAAADREHFLVSIGAHDHAIGLAQACPGGAIASAVRCRRRSCCRRT